ncbi:glycoside hydrolase superfamily [Cladochytrium replicatum]|nr:glycoside hydrolase superfamily [Cladochytrium replicatum]
MHLRALIGGLSLVVTLLVQSSSAATPAEWKSRNIYFLLVDRFAQGGNYSTAACTDLRKWCGGNLRGVIERLDYIQNMGFDAIWIAPIVGQKVSSDTTYAPYHGYHAKDLYSIDSHYGTLPDVQALARALHRRGMLFMLDVVPNHMGADNNLNNADWASGFNPFNAPKYFHLPPTYTDPGNPNWIATVTNQTALELVWFFGLADLNTEDPTVIIMLNNWVNWVKTNYGGVDGFRVDTARFIRKSFWPQFNANAGMYIVGEIGYGEEEGRAEFGLTYSAEYQQYMDGVLNFPAYLNANHAFRDTTGRIGMDALAAFWTKLNATYKNPDLLGNFIDNHDGPRFLALQPDRALWRNALTYIYATRGIPVVYSGTEQGFTGSDGQVNDPYNRVPLWTSGYSTSTPEYAFIRLLNRVRKQQKWFNHPSLRSVGVSQNVWAFARGSGASRVLVVLTNVGANSTASITINARDAFGSSCSQLCDILGFGGCLSLSAGNATITVSDGNPRIYVQSKTARPATTTANTRKFSITTKATTTSA